MSDDEDDYYDEDEYFWIDEGPVAEADDLAEHTMHSPVWIDYDPTIEVGEDFSDWEYYSDDYYDCIQDPRATSGIETIGKKRKSLGQSHKRKKRRRLDSSEAIPGFSLSESLDEDSIEPSSSTAVVRWKTPDTFTERVLPIIADDQGEKVALLKDWRERFKTVTRNGLSAERGGTVMENGMVMQERRNQANKSNKAQKSSPRAEARKSPLGANDVVNDRSTEYAVPVMKGGVVVIEQGIHPSPPDQTQLASNGAESSGSSVQPDKKHVLGAHTTEAAATKGSQSDTCSTSKVPKAASRKRKAVDTEESKKGADISSHNQQAVKHNTQHDASIRTTTSGRAHRPGRQSKGQNSIGTASGPGKEDGGSVESTGARRSKRAKQQTSS
ncbi:hypothetical protein MMC13_002679 [Lambiella insularis]|nr:hypothetical protein [Lambiella insularis]